MTCGFLETHAMEFWFGRLVDSWVKMSVVVLTLASRFEWLSCHVFAAFVCIPLWHAHPWHTTHTNYTSYTRDRKHMHPIIFYWTEIKLVGRHADCCASVTAFLCVFYTLYIYISRRHPCVLRDLWGEATSVALFFHGFLIGCGWWWEVEVSAGFPVIYWSKPFT